MSTKLTIEQNSTLGELIDHLQKVMKGYGNVKLDFKCTFHTDEPNAEPHWKAIAIEAALLP